MHCEIRSLNKGYFCFRILFRLEIQDIYCNIFHEYVILIGDLNRQFGNDNYGIRGNKSKISFGGELYRSLLKTHKYVLVNNLEQTYGGPWTWINRQDPESKSCLDICIVSNSLVPFVDKVTINNDRIFHQNV